MKCRNGHDKTPENTIIRSTGKRQCRDCVKESVARAKERRHANRDKQITKTALPADTPVLLEHYKQPLRKVKDGFGYYGTIAYDAETRSKTQCHICGRFFERVGVHVNTFHGQSADEYKKEFKIPKSVSLSAPNAKTKAFERWAKMTDKEKKAVFDRMNKAKAKKLPHRTKSKKSLYRMNIEDTCPDQVVDKLQKLAKELGRTPSHKEFERRWKISREAVIGRHGSFANAIRKAGLKSWVEENTYTPDELICRLIDFYKENGREAMTRDTGKHRIPTIKTYIKYFGSFTEAKEIAYKELK